MGFSFAPGAAVFFKISTASLDIQPIPEPASVHLLLGAGLFYLLILRKGRRGASARL